MQPVTVQQVTFYEDQVRSWKAADGRFFVVLRDPFLALGLDPNQQINQIKKNPLYEGCFSCAPITVLVGSGVERIFEVTTPPAQSRRLPEEVSAMNSSFLQHACDYNHYVRLQRPRPGPRTGSAAT